MLKALYHVNGSVYMEMETKQNCYSLFVLFNMLRLCFSLLTQFLSVNLFLLESIWKHIVKFYNADIEFNIFVMQAFKTSTIG